jgi:hypothetical protein
VRDGTQRVVHIVTPVPYARQLDGACDQAGLLYDIQEPVRVVLAADRNRGSDFIELPCAVVSDRMRSALDRAGVDNIQYLRASLEQRLSDRAIGGYWIANVIGSLACVDHAESVMENASEFYAGELLDFQIDVRATHGFGLFRVAEDLRLIAVQDRVRAVLEKAQLRGVLYKETCGRLS